MAGKANPGADGLLALPHLAGAACPEFDSRARGIFFGIGLGHRKGHFVRAIMESIAYMLRGDVEILEELGVEASEVRSLGGGSRSDLWCQIKSDVLKRPIVTLEVSETASLGAAILAGLGAGIYRSFEDACKRVMRPRKRFEPDPRNFDIYDRGYGLYRKLYEGNRELFREL